MNSEADLNDLYQEIILDHYKHPRHAARLAEDEVMVEEDNPNCGDQIGLTVEVQDGCIADIRYEAEGCAISTASASMMSEILVGKSVQEARDWVRQFTAMMKGEGDIAEDDLGDLIALEGVKRFPLRIKCATMAWHALNHALDKSGAE